MELVKMLDSDIINAMKDKDKLKLDTLRIVKAAMKQEVIDHKKEMNDELLIDTITHEIKTRKESIKEFEKGNRTDLITKTNSEIELLNKYLPKQLTESELDEIINNIFNEVKPESIKDMGKIMGLITPLVKGKADMQIVSSKVRELLSNK